MDRKVSLETALLCEATKALKESFSEYRSKHFRLYEREEKGGRQPIYFSPKYVSDLMLYEAFYKDLMHRINKEDIYKTLCSGRINQIMDDFSMALEQSKDFETLPSMPPDFDVRSGVREMLLAALINNSENGSFKISGLRHVFFLYDYLKRSKTVEIVKQDGTRIVYREGLLYFERKDRRFLPKCQKAL